jgi:hypothetical protein
MIDTPSEIRFLYHERGYRMIETAEIHNFLGFGNVQLSNLARVNILVGDNGAGKTALLEALFLALAPNTQIVQRFKLWRGVDAPSAVGSPQELYDGLFLDLFHGFNKDCAPRISLIGSNQDTRSLQFRYGTPRPTLSPFKETSQQEAFPGAYVPITFEWTGFDQQPIQMTPELQQTGIAYPPPFQLNHDPAFLAARSPLPTSQNARWFSELSKRGQEGKLIATIQAQFKSVQSVSVEVDMGNPAIFLKFPSLNQKIPIYLASDGLNKLVTLLLHIVHCEGTAVFVDEIENGFHFSRHERLWEQLFSFSDEYETQLFLSTHSWECLKAVAPLIERLPNDFTLVQVYQKNGVGNAVVVPGKNAAAAIENEIEVRGNSGNAPPA